MQDAVLLYNPGRFAKLAFYLVRREFDAWDIGQAVDDQRLHGKGMLVGDFQFDAARGKGQRTVRLGLDRLEQGGIGLHDQYHPAVVGQVGGVGLQAGLLPPARFTGQKHGALGAGMQDLLGLFQGGLAQGDAQHPEPPRIIQPDVPAWRGRRVIGGGRPQGIQDAEGEDEIKYLDAVAHLLFFHYA